MRTTVTIHDDLYRELKERAACSGRTVGAVLEDAVRIGLSPPQSEVRPFTTIRTSGRGGLMPGIDLDSNASVQAALDEGVPIEKLR